MYQTFLQSSLGDVFNKNLVLYAVRIVLWKVHYISKGRDGRVVKAFAFTRDGSIDVNSITADNVCAEGI